MTRAVKFRKVGCDEDGMPIGWIQNGTSLLESLPGSPSRSHFVHQFGPYYGTANDLKTSPAIVQALEGGELEKQMVENSDCLSSMSILLLPTILTLLPIALFQDASMLATVLYAVASDIASAMPNAIKGAELVIFGSRKHYAFNVDMYGVKNNTGAIAAEIFCS